MNEKELAQAVAAEFGQATEAEAARALDGDTTTEPTRSRGFTEVMAAGTFIASCARLAVQIYRVRQDRALLVQALLDEAPKYESLDPERRLGLIARIIDKLIPERFSASPSLGTLSQRTK